MIRLKRFSTRRLSCLWFQMFCVETNSFLPNQQSDGRDLASQGETRQMRFQTSGHTSLVEILKRSDSSRSRGRPFEDVFQIVIVVEVETTDGQDLLRTLKLPLDHAVFPTGVGPQGQA